jgi:hypothetical protein
MLLRQRMCGSRVASDALPLWRGSPSNDLLSICLTCTNLITPAHGTSYRVLQMVKIR